MRTIWTAVALAAGVPHGMSGSITWLNIRLDTIYSK
jgi:hypothetical protein